MGKGRGIIEKEHGALSCDFAVNFERPETGTILAFNMEALQLPFKMPFVKDHQILPGDALDELQIKVDIAR